MARFVEVPTSRMRELFESVRNGVTSRGGHVTTRAAGREMVWEIKPPSMQAFVHIYTSISIGSSAVRPVGRDAIRIVVGSSLNGTPKSFGKGKKVLRTAPDKESEEERVEAFIERLRDEIREAYNVAKQFGPCPKCSAAMAKRKARDTGLEFFGCTRYPDCKGTRNIKPIPNG